MGKEQMPPSRVSMDQVEHAPVVEDEFEPSTALPVSSLSTSTQIWSGPSALKRHSSEERERFRCDSVNNDTRLSICSTSGTVYESVVVVGHIYGSDNVVYYLLEVRSWEMPLEGYVIRRRYNEFKQLHAELTECMQPRKAGIRRSLTVVGNPFRGYSSSLICNPLPGAPPETSPLWSPPRVTSHRRGSLTGARLHGVEEHTETPRNQEQPTATRVDGDRRNSAPAAIVSAALSGSGLRPPPWSHHTNAVQLPFETVEFDETNGRPLLPPLPAGGVATFFTTRDLLIKQRIEQFNRILAAVLSDTSPRVAHLLMQFIQDNPSAQPTYVSLAQYSAIEVPWSVERHARRRATSMGKKALREQMAIAAS